MESLYLLILLFFIIIILVPISIRARVFYSVKSNKGAFAISLWFIKIKVAKIKIKEVGGWGYDNKETIAPLT